MSKYVKNKDSNTAWTIDEDGQTWTLGKNATISVANEPAIHIAATYDANVVRLRGDLVATGASGEGVRIEGEDSLLRIFQTSQIEARLGIHNMSTGNTIRTAGEIVGSEVGILSEATAIIRNAGHVSGDAGIFTTGDGGSAVRNLAAGVIEGEDIALRMSGSLGSEIFNAGRIRSDDVAVSVVSDGASELTNRGRIVGDILFGAGNDLIDTIGGRIRGRVDAGAGNDIYLVGKGHGQLSEKMENGWDTVNSTIGMTLRANFEQLDLLGKKSINGTGNDAANDIQGNSGDNALHGKGGDDLIEGGRGDDQLRGGGGADDFRFEKGGDRDTIHDFDIAQDQIALFGYEFDSLGDIAPHLSQHGDDTWISLGSGDRLVLKDVDMTELTEDNFITTFTSVM